MYFASVGDAAFLDSIGDRISSAADDVISSAKSEGERIVTETIATIAPSSPAPRVGLSSRVSSVARRPPSFTAAPLPSVSATPRPFGAAPMGGAGPAIQAAPLPAVSSIPRPLGAAPFRAPSPMVAPDLEVVPNYNAQPAPRFTAQAAQGEGMSSGTMIAIGVAVLAGLYFFGRK